MPGARVASGVYAAQMGRLSDLRDRPVRITWGVRFSRASLRVNSTPLDKEPEPERRGEQRYTVATEAQIARTDETCWQGKATVLNISANGLLLSMPRHSTLGIGVQVVVRFATTLVRGEVRHLTMNDKGLLVGVIIDDAQFG